MISIEDALALIQSHANPALPQPVPLSESPGLVLAADVLSDIDSPPFAKSMMDGIAVNADDMDAEPVSLKVAATVFAGDKSDIVWQPGHCVKIMTGAPLPDGFDSVIMREEVDEREESGTHFAIPNPARFRRGQNVLPRAATLANGEVVFAEGHLLRPHDVGVLAECGAAEVSAWQKPTLTVLATGDELVPANATPGAAQIRNSNGPMLEALARPWCCTVNNPGIVKDQREALSAAIERGLQSNFLVLAGGVSAGLADLVPSVLQELGVRQVFHKVAIKPGKPLWFGTRDQSGGYPCLVFGLPGNPVSALCCFSVFVIPALTAFANQQAACVRVSAELTQPHQQAPGRTVFWPSRCEWTKGKLAITPLNWKGSADLKTLGQANAFAIFPGEQADFQQGNRVQAFLLEPTRQGHAR